MEKREEVYAGKAKSVYKTDDPDRYILLFRDDTSAFDGEKVEQLDRKGKVNNLFNAFIMEKLEEAGIPTHHDKVLSASTSPNRRRVGKKRPSPQPTSRMRRQPPAGASAASFASRISRRARHHQCSFQSSR